MIIVSYDISNNKTRSAFSTFIKKYGRRLQFSVYEIKNSPRIQNIIIQEIETKFKKRFTAEDSVFIYSLCKADQSKTIRYGYNVNDQDDLVVFE